MVSKKESTNGTRCLEEAMIIAVAVLEQAIAILPTASYTETSATATMMVHVMTFIVGQTSANCVDIYKTASVHQKPISCGNRKLCDASSIDSS